jgi:hypothetical protein
LSILSGFGRSFGAVDDGYERDAVSRAVAVCPRVEHAGSRVRFDGQYGKPGHRRQLYRCVPANGDRPHRFTEVLPREEAWHDACEACERPVLLHEGPHAARYYRFVARGIAEALVAVDRPCTELRMPRPMRRGEPV